MEVSLQRVGRMVITHLRTASCRVALRLLTADDHVLFLRAFCGPCKTTCTNDTVIAYGIDNPKKGPNLSICEERHRTLHMVLSQSSSLFLDLTLSSTSLYATPRDLAKFWPTPSHLQERFPLVMTSRYSGYVTSLHFTTELFLPSHLHPWSSVKVAPGRAATLSFARVEIVHKFGSFQNYNYISLSITYTNGTEKVWDVLATYAFPRI